MIDDFETRFTAELRASVLPRASDQLRDRIRAIATTPRRRSVALGRARLRWAALAIVTALLLLAGALVLSSGAPAPPTPSASSRPSSGTPPTATFPSTVDGKPVLTVSQLLAKRTSGAIGGEPVVVAGYWSFPRVSPSCGAAIGEPGPLELYCYDGLFGITERNEPITGRSTDGPLTQSQGPALTPFVGDIAFSTELFSLPEIDGRPFPPVPIVVVGHLDDPGATKCRKEALQRCKDRLVIDSVVQFDPRAVVRPSPSPIGSVVDGRPVLSVPQVLAQRAAGGLVDQPVIVAGYWSNAERGHSCAPPPEQTGDLELYCSDGEYGITERDEPIMVVDPHGHITPGSGPALTPYFEDQVDRVNELFALPVINGQRYPPIPIAVLGHFDDPRSAQCRESARQICRDRLVVDRILQFDQLSVPTPAPTPSPTPFPAEDPPPALYETAACAEGHPIKFAGWTTLRSLGIDVAFPDETAYIVITRDPIVIGDWIDDPGGSGHRFRTWGQRVCYAYEGEQGVIGFTAMPGTAYREWDDGRHEPLANF